MAINSINNTSRKDTRKLEAISFGYVAMTYSKTHICVIKLCIKVNVKIHLKPYFFRKLYMIIIKNKIQNKDNLLKHAASPINYQEI